MYGEMESLEQPWWVGCGLGWRLLARQLMSDRRRLSIIWLNVVGIGVVAGAALFVQSRLGDQSSAPLPPLPKEPDREPAAPSGMAEAQREYLWQIEHHGNVLSRGDNGFRALGAA